MKTSATSCTWNPVPNVSWITIVGDATHQGSGTFEYSVTAAPATQARTGLVFVAGQTHTVAQAGHPTPPPVCTYAIDPVTATVPSVGGSGSFAVMAPAGCAWTATTVDAWMELPSGSSGSGDGVVTYSAGANPSSASREGRVTVADQTFLLHQDGFDTSTCAYTVGPTDFSPCMPAGAVTTHVETAESCPWTITSGEPWLAIDGNATRTGPGDARLVFTANYAAPRQGVAEVRWPTPTAGQNVRISQAGCVYGTTVSTVAVGSTGGSFSFGVLQQSLPNTCGGPLQDACIWTATASASWITITTPMPRQGDQNVSFNVASNASPQVRSATIAVYDRVVTVQQAGTP